MTNDFKNDTILYYDYKIKDITFKKLFEAFGYYNQIIVDNLDFIDYIKRTRFEEQSFEEQSFEENLFICIEQNNGFKNKYKIFSEDKKHYCDISPSCYPDMKYIEIDGFKAIIYTIYYKVRMFTLFSLLMNKHCLFKNKIYR